MAMANGQRRARTPINSKSVAGYALLAFCSLVAALFVGWWITSQADLLGVRFDRAYFVLLVILGISAAFFLFGALRSSAATVKGQYLGVAFDVGGPAALFLIVVGLGWWLTQPSPSFNGLVRLNYSGPSSDRPNYEQALPSAKLRVRIGLNTNDHPITNQGEVSIWDIPGRFRDGQFSVEVLSDRILLLDEEKARKISFPSSDQAVELRAALKEPPERRAAREEARAALMSVVQSVQKTLMRQDDQLFPAIDDFLASPSDDGWRRVLTCARRTQADIDEGIEIALAYDAKWGGLLGPAPQEIKSDVQSSSRDPLQGGLPSQLGGLIPEWNAKGLAVEHVPPNPALLNEVAAWRDRLHGAYKRVVEKLKPLIAKLTPQT